VIFWKDILSLIKGLVSSDPLLKKSAARYIGFIAIGTIPAALAGLLLKDFFEKMFLNPRAAGFFFFITAIFLFASLRRAKTPSQLNVATVLIIGLAQALAILPGVSRSGTTIATALILGIERKDAGRFSFLLGLPAILGAALLELKGISATALPPGLLLAAFGISILVGLAALKLLLNFVSRGRLFYFGFYLVAAGLVCLVFFR
jgi:undecaprenyl-diphosphatase